MFRFDCLGYFIAILLIAARAQASPIFMGLGDLPGGAFKSFANAVSGDGRVVVGASESASGNPNEAFRWTVGGGMEGLGFLPTIDPAKRNSGATGVSADGGVIVGGSSSGSGLGEAFIWTRSTGMQSVTQPVDFGVSDVSGDGTILVGVELGDSCCTPAFWTEDTGTISFLSADGGANAISLDGQYIVGAVKPVGAFRWSQSGGLQTLGTLPGASFSAAFGASSDGSLVVGDSDTEAFLWSEATGSMIGLGDLPGGISRSVAFGVSDDGMVIGNSTSDLGEEAFVWTSDRGMEKLQDVLVDRYGLVDALGWSYLQARDISPDGRVIVGSGVNPLSKEEAWIAVLPVPEPPAALILVAALIGLMLRRWAKARPE